MRAGAGPQFSKIVMDVGDSITHGYQTAGPVAPGWRGPLGAARPSWLSVGSQDDTLSISPTGSRYHCGIDGQLTTQVISAMTTDWAIPRKPDIVFLMLGVAQAVLVPISNAAYAANMATIMDFYIAQNPRVVIFLSGLTNFPSTQDPALVAIVAGYASMLPALQAARSANVILVSETVMADDKFSDTTHPNTAGYAIMATTRINAAAAAGL